MALFSSCATSPWPLVLPVLIIKRHPLMRSTKRALFVSASRAEFTYSTYTQHQMTHTARIHSIKRKWKWGELLRHAWRMTKAIARVLEWLRNDWRGSIQYDTASDNRLLIRKFSKADLGLSQRYGKADLGLSQWYGILYDHKKKPWLGSVRGAKSRFCRLYPFQHKSCLQLANRLEHVLRHHMFMQSVFLGV